jgi:integrase
MAKLYYFMEYTGCRIGEAAVLQQKHIDLEHHKAVIVQDIAFRGQTPEIKLRPKTEAGVREIDLYDNVIEILPRYDDPETFIFFPDGLPTRSGLATAQKHYRQEAGISATAHQLRHTYAGIMHSAEIDVKDTQARLGHANISTTQDIYTEIEKQHNEKQRNKANAYIMGERLKRPVASCPKCGSAYTAAPDGHAFTFCPDCGKKLIRKA